MFTGGSGNSAVDIRRQVVRFGSRTDPQRYTVPPILFPSFRHGVRKFALAGRTGSAGAPSRKARLLS